jgi:hypothetical protein
MSHTETAPRFETTAYPVSFSRADLDAALTQPDNIAPAVIDLLHQDFQSDLIRPVDTWQTLEEHTVSVVAQAERNIDAEDLPQGISKAALIMTAGLHDMGKPRAYDEGKVDRHHAYGKEIISSVLPQLGFSKYETKVLGAVVDGDPIGGYLTKQVNARQAARAMTSKAQEVGMPLEDFWKLQKAFYIADASAYSSYAGQEPTLDHLFQRNAETNKVELSEQTAGRVAEIEEAFADARPNGYTGVHGEVRHKQAVSPIGRLAMFRFNGRMGKMMTETNDRYDRSSVTASREGRELINNDGTRTYVVHSATPKAAESIMASGLHFRGKYGKPEQPDFVTTGIMLAAQGEPAATQRNIDMLAYRYGFTDDKDRSNSKLIYEFDEPNPGTSNKWGTFDSTFLDHADGVNIKQLSTDGKGEYMIPPERLKGVFDLETGVYTPNPYFGNSAHYAEAAAAGKPDQ